MVLPDFFIVGAPKAGTTALHTALMCHPSLYFVRDKEPKYYLCDDRRPPRAQHRGPGDAHSRLEWVWRRSRYEAMFAESPAGALRGESTPFYLYDQRAQERIQRDAPGAKLIAVLRDPIERAYSNWMHLWSDGLEPISDFVRAWSAEPERIAAGWAPFWHYRRLGLYGEQLRHLYRLFPAEQVHVLRYRDLVDDPVATLDGVCHFLGVRAGLLAAPPSENSRPFVADTRRTEVLASLVRSGAALGAWAPPRLWRAASRPLIRALHRGGTTRPVLAPAVRLRLAEELVEDVRLLEQVTGVRYGDWLTGACRERYRQPGAMPR
jgi:hypothetical protein